MCINYADSAIENLFVKARLATKALVDSNSAFLFMLSEYEVLIPGCDSADVGAYELFWPLDRAKLGQ